MAQHGTTQYVTLRGVLYCADDALCMNVKPELCWSYYFADTVHWRCNGIALALHKYCNGTMLPLNCHSCRSALALQWSCMSALDTDIPQKVVHAQYVALVLGSRRHVRILTRPSSRMRPRKIGPPVGRNRGNGHDLSDSRSHTHPCASTRSLIYKYCAGRVLVLHRLNNEIKAHPRPTSRNPHCPDNPGQARHPSCPQLALGLLLGLRATPKQTLSRRSADGASGAWRREASANSSMNHADGVQLSLMRASPVPPR